MILVVVLGLIRPVYADDHSTRQEDVRQQLAASASQISDLNVQMAARERSVTDTQQRIERERAQVRMLARALYAQPDSLVALVFESSSLTEAMTRIADLTSAGDRAAATKRALDRDLSRLAQQRAQLQVDRDRQVELKRQLENQFARLTAQDARMPVQPAPPQRVDPASVAAIKQIIMDAFAPLGATAQQWALRVAMCESGYNPYAVNPSGASGLFQFMPATWRATPQGSAGASVFDPKANAEAAAWLYNRSGPGQWSCK